MRHLPLPRRSTGALADLRTLLLIAGVLVTLGLGLMTAGAFVGSLTVPVPTDHVLTSDSLTSDPLTPDPAAQDPAAQDPAAEERDTLRPPPGTSLPPGVRLADRGSIEVEVADPSPAQSWLGLLSFLPTSLVVLLTLVLLRRALGRCLREDPFHPATIRTLRRLGPTIFLAGAAAWALESLVRFALVDSVTSGGPAVSLEFTAIGVWLIVATTVAAFAEVMQRGRELRTELDGVI